MPRPGKEPLKRFHLEKGPVYRHCSLCIVSGLFGVRCGDRKAYYRAHGSPFVPFFAAAANFCGSKPVMLGFARVRLRGLVVGAKAGKSANWDAVYAELTMRASLCGYVETQRESEDCRRGLLKQLATSTPCLGESSDFPAFALTCIVPSAVYHLSNRQPQKISTTHASPRRGRYAHAIAIPGHQHHQIRPPHAYSPASVSHTSYPVVAPPISHNGRQQGPLPRP